MLTASFCFALTGACARYLRDEISPVQLVLFRNLIGVIFILLSLYRRPAMEEGGKSGLLLFRGIIGTLALYAFFYGISKIGLAIAITYQQSYPIFLALAGFFLYGDRLAVREWIAILLGFLGIFFIFAPSLMTSSLTVQHHAIGILNALTTGMAYLSIRGLSRSYDERTIILVFMLTGIALPILSLLAGIWIPAGKMDFLVARPAVPSLENIPAILLLGIAALFGQMYLTRAFSYQKTGVIGAVGYSNVVFSVFFGICLGDAVPGAISQLGILLVMACGIWLSFLQRK